MDCPSRSNELDLLRRKWQQWVDVVELFARRARRRSRVNPETYSMLHRDLVQTCRAFASKTGTRQQEFFCSLQEMVQPWLTPRILAQTEQTMLADLLDSSLRAEWQLTGRKRRPWLRRWMLRGIVLGSVAGGILWVASYYPGPVVLLLALLPELWEWFLDTLAEVTAVQWLLLVGTLGVLAGMFIVLRVPRS
jgi:hypothetical protein